MSALDRWIRYRGGADRLRREHAGTRLGVEPQVAPGWADYRDASSGSPAEIERRAREVHYDVLRREGIDADRAREIAAESADGQARLLDRIRGERGVVATGDAPARPRSGWDVRTILPSALLDPDEG